MITLTKNAIPEKYMFDQKALKRLIVPLIFEQFLNAIVGMADTMMVSSAGETAVSGVALVDLINLLIITIFSGLATGGAVVASQLIGAGHKEKAKKSANQLIYIASFIGILMMLIVCFFKVPVLNVLFGSTEQAVMNSALDYFFISAFSYPFIAIYNACAALFRAQGNSKISMYISVAMNLMNVGLNAVFIYAYHRGADGVALATTISRVFAAIVILVLLKNKKNKIYIEKLWRFKFDFSMIKRILVIGIPSCLENSFFQLGRVILVSLISTFGTVHITANAVANNLDMFGILPAQAMGLALLTVVGQCVGAGDYQQVRFYVKKLLKTTYLLMWVWNIAIFIALPFLLGLYQMSDETYRLAVILIIIHNSCAMILWPSSFTLPSALRAANDVRFPMGIAIFSMCMFRVCFSYVFGVFFGLGVIGVWIAMILDWLFRVVCFVTRTRNILFIQKNDENTYKYV